MNAIDLRLFGSRLQAICDEMGITLRRAAFSPNIKDRLDFSCAVFAPDGRLLAQAAHIPVHLGSMAFAMRDLVRMFAWDRNGSVILNDPFLGGTHLPDVTLITPVFAHGYAAAAQPIAFVVNRAHHANIGAAEPGSMPVSRSLAEEGVLIAPQWLLCDGILQHAARASLAAIAETSPAPGSAPNALLQHPRLADLRAQISASELGRVRVQALFAIDSASPDASAAFWADALLALDAYAERVARAAYAALPDGEAQHIDVLDDDGQGNVDLPIALRVRVAGSAIDVDFAGTVAQVAGNVNCPLSVTAAAVFYVFRCLLPADAPACAGTFAPIRIHAQHGALVHARTPAAVAAGNVETSMRIVDVLLGALAKLQPGGFPAASQGTMNNVAMGARTAAGRWDYYETIAGGHGAGPAAAGLSARHAHMTNTLNTPIESLEAHYPLRIRRYARRQASGGVGLHAGGEGVEKEFEFLAPTRVSLLTERRRHAPSGLAGGGAGACGENLLNGQPLGGKVAFDAKVGDRLLIRTPGGGGFGARPR